MATGMTIKQFDRQRFYALVEAYRELRDDPTPEGKHAFILLSIQLHIAKGRVPKRLWPLINK